MFRVCWARLIGAFDGQSCNTGGSHFPTNVRAIDEMGESRHVRPILMLDQSFLAAVAGYVQRRQCRISLALKAFRSTEWRGSKQNL